MAWLVCCLKLGAFALDAIFGDRFTPWLTREEPFPHRLTMDHPGTADGIDPAAKEWFR